MIPNIAEVVWADVVKGVNDKDKDKTEQELAEYFGSDKSETEDDADEVVIVESVNELQGKN